MVAGLSPSARDNDAFEGMQGKFFSSDTADEAILQIQFADELLSVRPGIGEAAATLNTQTQSLIGKELTLRYAERSAAAVAPSQPIPNPRSTFGDGRYGAMFSVLEREKKLRIVALTDQDPEGIRGVSGARVFVPLHMLENLHVPLPSGPGGGKPDFSNSPAYPSLSVRVRDPNRIESVQDSIRKMGFNTFSILDATRGLRRFFAVLDLFLGIFGSLALAVAALGIVNTLVMAILERRREIGIMKAIGASDGDVKKLFLAEAAVMGLFGGGLGVALGWVIGRVINVGTNFYLRRQNLPPENLWAVPWWLVAGAIAFAIVISMISGLYPAARAAKLDPVQALRYE